MDLLSNKSQRGLLSNKFGDHTIVIVAIIENEK